MAIFSSYGEVPADKQAALIRSIGQSSISDVEAELTAALLETIRKQNLVR